SDMTHVQAVLKIRGNKGTTVTLTIKRQSSIKPLTVKVIRDKIPMITVTNKTSKLNDKNVGIITISTFSEKTAEEFTAQLQTLEKQNIKGLVVDVRGNPGGYLSSVQEIVNQLSPKGMPIVKIQNRDGVVETYYSKFENKKSYPIAVLTDKGSASASEILAAALHDGAGYPLIGEKTFGKGTVQQAVPLGDGSQIKLTMFKWLSPKGTWIHKKGIAPDIVVNNGSDRDGTKEDKQLQAALKEVTK
ncbi:MAG: S41 family peptidase, partial [Bacilli bacterium]